MYLLSALLNYVQNYHLEQSERQKLNIQCGQRRYNSFAVHCSQENTHTHTRNLQSSTNTQQTSVHTHQAVRQELEEKTSRAKLHECE